MSSPNHPTSDIEDDFSSNSPNYTLASLDYSSASPRNASSKSSNNSYGLVPIVLPTLSLFHDDPYIKDFYSRNNPQGYPSSSPVIYGESLWIQSMSSRTTRENHHHQATRMAPKRTSTSTTPVMTQAATRQLVTNSVVAALEAQAANMANTDNTNKNPEPRETPTVRKCTYKEFISCQPFSFSCTEGAVGLIRWFERTDLVFFRSNYTEDYKVKFTTVKKMEDEFYNLVVKGNDLKTYARRFQELATLCPNMVLENEKLMEVFIGGFPQSIEGTVIASKPQTLEEAINIA
uniref:Reverse transcriptase domain-containing protein n=1 Tax=Tanacetum cinerariifolium TaxID=118510 RepID=A0A6L2MJL7_TANCI|nr:reverse transcriptase domain-containing protein [Tanacetum cinerariifolium]